MTDYQDMSFIDLLDLAKQSSGEVACIGNGQMIDYEVGTMVKFTDAETAMFLASARDIVLELCRRLEPFVRAYAYQASNWKDCDLLNIYIGTRQLHEQLWLDENMTRPLTGKHLRETAMTKSEGEGDE